MATAERTEAGAVARMQARLSEYLANRLESAVEVSGLTRIPGGASRETWSFDACWAEDSLPHSQGFILRRDPEASLLVSDRELEFRVYRALADTAVPAPRVFWLESDSAWLDRPFFIMERLAGETAPQAVLAPSFPAGHALLGRQMVTILAQIHALDWRGLGLDDLGVPQPEECGPREVHKWEQILRAEMLEPQPVLDSAIRWLAAHPPKTSRICLVHGDYRTGNYLADASGIRAILDWEMAHLGDPFEDLGWTSMLYWRWGSDRVDGLLPRREYFRAYEAVTGTPVDEEAVHFWEVLGNVKMAVISLTGGRSFISGRSLNQQLASVAHATPRLELELLDLLGL